MDSNIRTPIIEPSTALGARAALVLDSITSDALANPRLDASLFLGYRALAEGNRRWMKLAVDTLNRAIAAADALYSTRRIELFGGLSGLGWVVEEVTRQLGRLEGRPDRGEGQDSELNGDTDAALLLELQRGRWKGTCDLASGLVGIGVYFLRRLPARKAKEGLELVLAHLEDASQAALPFAGCAGVATGVGGTLYLLNQAAAAGVDERRITRLFAKCEETLVGSRRASAAPCSWWEGQLGTAAVCLGLGARAGAHECSRWAAGVVEQCLRCSPEETADVSLLKGAAGTAHLWHRIYRAGGDPRCRAASRLWWARVIESCEQGAPATRAAEVEFLGGSAGVGLALSAALTPVEPEWDGLLCLSPGTAGQHP